MDVTPETKEIAKAGLRAIGAQDTYIAELEAELASARAVIEGVCSGAACLPGYGISDALTECANYLRDHDLQK
jgi:hypothetical protein